MFKASERIRKMWTKIKQWWFDLKFDKEMENNPIIPTYPLTHISPPAEIENEENRELTQAILKIKKQIQDNANGDLAKYLTENPELLPLAAKEDSAELIDTLRRTIIRQDKDIKTDEDLRRFIDTRITSYYEAQRYKERLALSRQIRMAEKNGDVALKEKLMSEWQKKLLKEG